MGTNVCVETLDAVTRREVEADRMAPDDELRVAAVNGMAAPHYSRAELEALAVQNSNASSLPRPTTGWRRLLAREGLARAHEQSHRPSCSYGADGFQLHRAAVGRQGADGLPPMPSPAARFSPSRGELDSPLKRPLTLPDHRERGVSYARSTQKRFVRWVGRSYPACRNAPRTADVGLPT